jgi:TIR domain
VSTSLDSNVYRVFFSHGGEDTYIVNHFFGPKVRASGAEVFIDEGEVSYGDDFRDIVFRQLHICDELLVLLTPSSVKRPWVFAELGAAILRAVHVVAIRYGVSEEELRALGILSILGTKKLLVPAECDRYVEQLRDRVVNKRHG